MLRTLYFPVFGVKMARLLLHQRFQVVFVIQYLLEVFFHRNNDAFVVLIPLPEHVVLKHEAFEPLARLKQLALKAVNLFGKIVDFGLRVVISHDKAFHCRVLRLQLLLCLPNFILNFTLLFLKQITPLPMGLQLFCQLQQLCLIFEESLILLCHLLLDFGQLLADAINRTTSERSDSVFNRWYCSVHPRLELAQGEPSFVVSPGKFVDHFKYDLARLLKVI